jgi:hypothetical protein
MFQDELQRPSGCVVSISETKRFHHVARRCGGKAAQLLPSRHLCRPYSQRREGCRSAGCAADQLEMAVNVKTAKGSASTFRSTLLALADEVIE